MFILHPPWDRMTVTRQVDCRGLECPKPVVDTKQALDEIESGTITVIVDNATSRENIKRFAKGNGYQVAVRKE